ncbi:MAG: hypothetical protein DMF57_02015 [Acidobacteria bacterium]|nr:MAG: hypothetical protein DMF57_02015 [Acidobacteriota bacterium]
MNFAHLHLILTHFPPVLSLGGAASAAAGVLRRRRDLLRIALMLLIGVRAMTPLVYIAGNAAGFDRATSTRSDHRPGHLDGDGVDRRRSRPSASVLHTTQSGGSP